MLAFLEQQRDAGRWDVAIEPIAGRYAVLCRVSPPAHADTG